MKALNIAAAGVFLLSSCAALADAEQGVILSCVMTRSETPYVIDADAGESVLYKISKDSWLEWHNGKGWSQNKCNLLGQISNFSARNSVNCTISDFEFSIHASTQDGRNIESLTINRETGILSAYISSAFLPRQTSSGSCQLGKEPTRGPMKF